MPVLGCLKADIASRRVIFGSNGPQIRDLREKLVLEHVSESQIEGLDLSLIHISEPTRPY